jgi:endonuclease/exonuclease/phosphatase family metal-dependent hydrolase
LDKSNDRTFYVYNTHFDHESENSRRRSALSIVDLIAGRTDASAPVIVTGDFNSPEESVVVKYLQGLESMDVAGKILRLRHTDRLVDTFRVANPNAEVVGTAAPFDRGRLSKKIDYIFIGIDQWKVDSSSILDDKFDGRFPSDHIPVVVDLSWR